MTLTDGPEGIPTLRLDEVLNLAAARPLAEALAFARGSDLDISAADVRHIGAQCGQILVAGVNAWRADGHSLRVVDATAGFDEGLHLLGLDTFFSDGGASQ